MSAIATAIVGTAVVSGVAQSNAAKKAAASQDRATDSSIGEQQRQYDLTREDYAPYREVGTRALRQLETENTLDGEGLIREVMADPGYQFGLRQGQLALDRKASAAGGRVSGAALKSAAQYATDYGTTGFNAAYQRRNDRLNRIASLAQIGQTSTGASAAAGQNSANAISSLISNQGDATGAARLAQGNIWGNTMNQIGAAAQQFARPQTISGFNGNQYSGYTNVDPTAVGPRPNFG